ncbi:MAG TPA: protein phosphatase 2C domain-containing protein [Gemmatimonadales bacterium]
MTTIHNSPVRRSRPMASDIDVFGLTHQGKVRKENQDQFLIASLHKTMQIQSTSLPPERLPELMSESRGFVFLVADGVGGMPGGQQASGTALSAIAHYVTHTMRLYYHHDPDEESKFLADLQESVLHSHSLVRAEGEADPLREGMATTLTLVAVLWPRAYVVHVGDSRLYILRQGRLDQITKDQTMAQALVDAGVLDSANLDRSPFKSILSSAVGGSQATPMTMVTDVRWDDVMLLCTDGLTKHVTEAEIQQYLAEVHSAELICRKLVDLALERGGTDNVTVVAGRLKRNAGLE